MAANAIGNAADLPARSLEAVRTAELVIFEEDRVARQVLKAAGVHREYWRYSEHQQAETLEKLKDVLQQGKTAVYMSDQGLPVIADPGAALLQVAYGCDAQVQVIPGPSSVLAAVAACPFIDGAFHFAGFLPREPEHRLHRMKTLDTLKCPIIILDTPYRLANVLETAAQAYTPKRRGLLALDISGEQENYIYGPLSQLLETAKELDEKMNFVLIIDTKLNA